MLPRLLTGALLLAQLFSESRAVPSAALGQERFEEKLRLTPFAEGKVQSEFGFVLEGPWRDEGVQLARNVLSDHHSLVPHRLMSLVRRYRVSAFELTLSSGRWSPTWPIHMPASIPASGIELTAWLELLGGESDEDERRRWQAFTSAVSGLFCAGIANDGIETSTASPTWAVPFPTDAPPDEHHLYRLVMPRLSAACTESLTPFISLLPCSSRAGLASLLNPHRLFDGEFTSIAISFVHYEQNQTARFQLDVGGVQDPVRLDRLTGQLGRRSFSLSSLYDRTVKAACPVADNSSIELVIPSHSINPFVIEPDLARETRNLDGREVAIWDVKQAVEEVALNVQINWPEEHVFSPLPPSKLPIPPLTARRLRFGGAQGGGRLGAEVRNNQDVEVEVVWAETWPWWIKAFVHTLEAQISGNSSTDDAILDLDYSPAIARSRPTTLQALVRIPARSTVQLTLAWEAAGLWYTEYPADSNRGFSLPGATVVLLAPIEPDSPRRFGGWTRDRQRVLQLHTPTTLLSLWTPDFSMPYNVIILSSTVIALYFGSIVNGLLRRWRCIDLSGGNRSRSGAADVKLKAS